MNVRPAHRVWVAIALLASSEAGAQRRPVTVLAPRSEARPAAFRGPVVFQPKPDAWFGRDKVRHFGASTAIQLLGYGSLRLLGASSGASIVGATVITATAGIGKELHDSRRGGEASMRDLVWDGAGAVAGIGLARLGDIRR